ncbi:hypothetical protein [Changchengzhania lutea]|uniref:hypothetical protein n=1 Tax=Changchengzhania lutea TaxID=2049305 RepID=UPI00115D858C|nr:hypothetical protein [Changchengzhania lutea]
MKKVLLLLCLTILFTNCQNKERKEQKINYVSDSIWTYSDRKVYSMRNIDSTDWDMEMLLADIESVKQNKWPTKPALSNFPSAVAKYGTKVGATGVGTFLGGLELEMEGKLLKGVIVGYQRDKYREVIDQNDLYGIKFNLLWVTVDLNYENGSNSVVSRNYPHYLSTGKQKTNQGNIDWVQMTLADGSNFAIINQRYFDLEFGKTIIIMPLKDGSLRFYQTNESIGSLGKYNEQIFSKKAKQYYDKLKSNKDLILLLKNNNIVEQEIN